MTAEPVATAAGGRTRSWRNRLDRPDQLLGATAAVLLPLGLLVILLGWYGASHTPYLFEQVPYLISGGLVGLGLVLTGGLCYFGGWIARSAEQQRATGLELVSLLQDIRAELTARPAAAPTGRTRKSADNGHAPGLVATSGGSMLHRPDCAVVLHRQDLRAASPGGGLAPCGLCQPLSSQPA